MNTKKLSQRCLSFFLSILMILPMQAQLLTAYADDLTTGPWDENAGEGAPTGGEAMTNGYGWKYLNQGYRVTLLSGNQLFPSLGASAVADIVYSQPPNNKVEKQANRLGQNSRGILQEVIGQGGLAAISGLPKSITDQMAANGEAVREYLLNGAMGGGGQGNPGGGDVPVINWSKTGGGGSGTASGNNTSGQITADERADAQQIVTTSDPIEGDRGFFCLKLRTPIFSVSYQS